MIHIVPIRHHSPACSLMTRQIIARVRPKLILVEGPADAQPLIPILTDGDTRPPVAILAYEVPETQEAAKPRRVLYPFAAYSPEYVALMEATRLNVEARFIDIPATVALNWYTGVEPPAADERVFEMMAARSGYRSFEEFWETAFESGGLTADELIASLLDYAAVLRDAPDTAPPSERRKDRYREQVMAGHLQAALDDGYQPDDMLVVCGALHAAALREFASMSQEPPRECSQSSPPGSSSSPAGDGELPLPVRAELTVIPFSYPRLSEHAGYGAGNRAPQYYQTVYDHGGDFGQASLEMLITAMNRLHAQGHVVSLADVIDAHRLARSLAAMRRKCAPGVEEIREALTACLLHGESAAFDEYIGDVLIGQAVGRVSSKIGPTALQQEFQREVRQRGLPLSDSPQEVLLRLTNAVEIGTSIFLHRLRVAEIPFARASVTVAGAHASLSAVREKWDVQWTPAVDAALVERSVEGIALADVSARLLLRRLAAAHTTAEAAEALLEMMVCDLPGLLRQAVRRCDALAAADGDVVSLARACRNLHALWAYGASRPLPREELEGVLTHVFTRAVLLLPDASRVSDDGADAVCTALKTLSDLASRAALLNADLVADALSHLLDSYAAHPKLSGLAASLAYQAGQIDDERLRNALAQRLSAGNSALRGAWFLDGFLSVTRLVLVNNPAVVRVLDGFVRALHPDDFLAALPMLRRAFAALSAGERGYLLGHLGRLHDLTPDSEPQSRPPVDADALRDLNDITQALDDLF